MKPKILIVDDEQYTREGLKRGLEEEGYDILLAENGEEALNLLSRKKVDLILADLRMPGMDGMEVLKQVREISADIPVILLTAYGSIENAVEAMKEGAFDYLTKPVNLDEVNIRVKKALERKGLEKEYINLKVQLEKMYGFENIVGKSKPMMEVFDILRQIAPSPVTVLIQGESGTGKELVAKAIHFNSPRKNKPFVAVHCASLSPGVLESELFGHEKGAFTGALEMKIGRFEMADRGTIFLDEISEIDLSTQVKLLRVLQEREFERVGGTKPIKVDVRVVAATNANLEERIKEGKFRKDLYYRLNVVTVTLPPLRDRKEDIPLLVNSFLKEFGAREGKNNLKISPRALSILLNYDWPGNVRELRNCIENMVVLSKRNTLALQDIPLPIRKKVSLPIYWGEKSFNLKDAERDLIRKALESTGNNKSKAATLLGVSRRTLHRKLKEYELDK